MSSEATIKVKNLSKTYQIYDKPHKRLFQLFARGNKKYFHEHCALKNINFELYPGETLGIIGCNGSGKSTLLQIIAGTLNASSGSVNTSGRVAALLELGAGFNPEFSGHENLFLSGQLYGLSNSEILEKYEAIVEFSGIRDYINQPVKTYSSGMFVRLAFSVIAHLEPKILIVDEALSVGDFIFQQKCAKFMKNKLVGATKILVSHDLAAIASMTDRVLVIDKGEQIFLGDTKSGLAEYQKIVRKSTDAINIKPNELTTKNKTNESRSWIEIDQSNLSGAGNATILRADWSVDDKFNSSTIQKNEKLKIDFILKVKQEISEPVIGYQIQNKFGIVIFGENTASSDFSVAPLDHNHYHISMDIIWPQVEPGDYGVTLGIGNGNDSTAHIIECWAHNIIVLSSIKTDPIHGIFNRKLHSFSIDRAF